MSQKEFTDYVVPRLLNRLPESKRTLSMKEDDSSEIEYESEKGKITLVISTRNNELTVGFAKKNKFEWHVHMDMLGAETTEEMIELAANLSKDILQDNFQIKSNTEVGYFIEFNDTETTKAFEESEGYFYWSEL